MWGPRLMELRSGSMGKFVEGGRWLDSWWRLGASVAGGIVALGGPYLGSLSDDPLWQGAGLLVGVMGLLVSALLPIAEKNKNNRQLADLRRQLARAEEKARTDFLFLTDFNLTPLVQKLGKVVLAKKGSRDLETQAAELRHQALGTAREVIGGEHKHVRANYFKLTYPRPDMTRLVEAGSTAKAPRPYFDFSTEEGEEVMNMIAQSGSRFCPSVIEEPPPGWDSTKQREYETFISVTAGIPGLDPDGMMTVDGRKKGDLTKADISMLKLIATVVALSESQRNAP